MITIEVTSQAEIECLIAVLSIGLCVGLENKQLTIPQAEKYLFSPYTMKILKKMNASLDIIDLVHAGTELENIDRLIPLQLQESIEEMKSSALSILGAQIRLGNVTIQVLNAG